jgi:peroxiredoxin
MSDMPKVGELAPDFELRDDKERLIASPPPTAISPSSTSTPPTTRRAAPKEACSFRDNDAAFKAADTEVWG